MPHFTRSLELFSDLQIALAKSSSVRGASHQPAFMVSWLTTSQMCSPCLLSRWVSPGCSMTLYDWANGGSVGVFLRMVWF